MDRKIIYPGQIPMVEDQLQAARFSQIGIGRLAGALYGEGGVGASGFACTPGDGMSINIAPGEIIQPGVIDGNAFGVLPAVLSPLPRQYILATAITLTVPSGGGTYIVYGTPETIDAENAALPFYNSANPNQTFAGQENNGLDLPTVRTDSVTVGIGSSVPNGSYPLWSIVVPTGATSISSSMIALAVGAPFYANLRDISARIIAPFSSSLAAALGGYPINVIVSDPNTPGVFWVSTADNNLTVPGAENASWTNMLGDFLQKSLTTNQDVQGPVTFEASPVVPLLDTGASTYQAVSAAWVKAVLANYLSLVATDVQTVVGAVDFEASPVVPLLAASANTYQVVNAAWVNNQLANYLNINETTQQEVAGLVGFQVTPTVPTLASGTKTDQVATTKFACGSYSGGSSGYKIHPDGSIEQWGIYKTTQSDGSAALNFPMPFPNSCDVVLVCEARAGGSWGTNQPTVHGVNDTPGTGGFVALTRGWSGGTFGPTSATGYYIARGS